jgi:hypothetical protein
LVESKLYEPINTIRESLLELLCSIKMRPRRHKVISKRIKDSLRPTEVHKNTDGITYMRRIGFFAKFFSTDCSFANFNTNQRLNEIRNVERILIAMMPGHPHKTSIFAGKYTSHRNIVGAAIQPLAVCACVLIGNLYKLLNVSK